MHQVSFTQFAQAQTAPTFLGPWTPTRRVPFFQLAGELWGDFTTDWQTYDNLDAPDLLPKGSHDALEVDGIKADGYTDRCLQS